MRFPIIRTVFFKELRELLRDRRSMLIMFGVPLVLYPVMLLGMGALGEKKINQLKSDKYTIVVQNAADAPKLIEIINQPESGISIVDKPDPEQQLLNEKIQAILVVPEHAEQRARASEEVHFKIEVDRSRQSASFVEGKVDRAIHEYERWIIEQRLATKGVPADVLKGIKTDITDLATSDQRFGHLMSSILPLFLLITGMLGAFFPALSVTTTEREHGTLETLLVTPAGRTELLIAKGTLVLLCALLTAGLNLLSMSMVMWRVFSMLPDNAGGTLTISPSALGLAYLAAVPTLIFFSAIVLVVGLLARTYREASSMATPVMLLPVISMVVGLAEPKISAAILITPIVNTTVIIREALTGRVSIEAFAAAFAASCLYAGLLVSAAARLFSNEQLVNSNWEPLSIRGLTKLGSSPRRRLPGIDEAVALWAVTILLSFYVTPSLSNWPLLPLVAVVEIGLITLPTLLTALLAKWQWRETFSWRSARPRDYLAAVLAGLGMIPIASTLFVLQNKLWPASADYFRINTEPLAKGVIYHPIIVTLAVGLLAGFCEEFLYRGPLQRALLRKLPVWWALVIGATLFSAAHLDTHGFPLRLLLGLALGFIVYRTRSIFPAMLAHGLYDATQVAYLAYQVHSQGVDAAIQHASTPEPLGLDTFVLIGIGIVFLLIAYYLLRPSSDSSQGLTPRSLLG
ncbi:MAG TPA: ABC transporter permease subunit/CPBP intramembrane protease [Tepidisphaeraceae bacterium]|jgi:sodium transport system permease protein|nr:ABC transporter permease subunit/CPBP intramembrane protease [Tepidisphaeraceae bacterium]